MKNKTTRHFKSIGSASRTPQSSGFTMIELMVAMAVFLVVGGAALTLFKQHAELFNDQQNQVGLNISLRNALSQMESDVVNAGTGYSKSADISSWPIGVTIQNNVGGTACHTAGTQVYTAACFDTLNIVSPNPTSIPGQFAAAVDTSKAPGTATIIPPVGVTATTLAAGFSNGSQVLFMHNAANGSSSTTMTTATLNAAPVVNAAAGTVTLSFGATLPDGTNAACPPPPGFCNDPLGLTTNVDLGLLSATLTSQFDTVTDWVVPLASYRYWVDASNPLDPQLKRGNDVIADQIIGFKVGASTVINNAAGVVTGSTTTYSYNASKQATDSPWGYQSQYDQIRSVRISIIGRTPPGERTGNGTFRNGFDNGPYRIQSMSIVVNPRNLSMNDK
ncbi:MAG TPA: prepilin-type N-terminal cleavage/methylation domain-containing protein [Candidatus Acidoferrum sp.]|jgi:prepilin-type N-terminal cleavage/methylation domain-containing protein